MRQIAVEFTDKCKQNGSISIVVMLMVVHNVLYSLLYSKFRTVYVLLVTLIAYYVYCVYICIKYRNNMNC